jgi:alkylation response protein AidB-like acyl-CoA dehydrogenase
MAFFQDPPRLGNTFDEDPLLGDHLARVAPELAAAAGAELRELGALSGGAWYEASLADRLNEPQLTQWDPWGNRVDRIEVSPVWREAQGIAARWGLVAAGYEPRWGAHARTHQFALVHVAAPSLDFYGCPLAMTDGAARTLLDAGDAASIERYVSRLTSRDPAVMWTSGQWMTERTGGSDVSQTETVARPDGAGGWKLFGTKWFTSATTAQMALTLARPDGNPEGSRGLAMFLVETRDERGLLRGITVNRLKDKLGTRKVPTAELTLDGAPAMLVGAAGDGVRAITPMLSVTRTWNAVSAACMIRRALALASDYARRRRAFGALLVDKPLHVDTLAGLEAEYAGAFLLAFRAVELLGLRDHGGSDEDERLARALTPIAKLTTAKQAVSVISEAIEACGGAGYVEDTGLPRLLADAQVLPIWEGTTNVLSLDTLRALGKGGAIEAIAAEVKSRLAQARDAGLAAPVAAARDALDHALAWVTGAMSDPTRLEAGARRFALTLGRALELGYLCAHAQWCVDHGKGPRSMAAARRFAMHGVDQLTEASSDDAKLLVRV